MSSYTVAQALATSASGILVVDTPTNIATNLSNSSLVSRVSLFSMSGNGAVSAWQAAALAAIGTKFSMAGFKLTERDTVAQLITPAYAAGAAISGIAVAVTDTAANILAAAANPIIHNASSVSLTANATLTLSQLLTLEGYSSFTAPGLTLTLADTAANLLAFTPAEAKAALTVFQLTTNAVVTAAQAVTLGAMSHFGFSSGVTLTISDSVANIVASASSLHSVLLLSGTAVNFSDTMADLLAQAGTFQWSQYPSASVTLSVSSTATVSQALTLETLPNFGIAAGQSLTIADAVNNLVTLSAPQAAIASAIALSGNDTATAAQLVALAALPHFSPGHTLTVDDTLADLATLTTPQRALATAETIDDTVSHLLAALPAALSGATAIVAELDGATLTAGQAIELAGLAAHATLTLHPNGSNTTLTIADTAQNLAAASASITTLEGDGPVTAVPTGSSNGTILSAAAAVALLQSSVNPADGTYAVADTGSALSAVASQLFGEGFEAITVTSGTFAGTMAQLLDPTLHFTSGSSAQLNASAVSSVAQALELAALPTFSIAASVTVTVLDSITDILAAAATLPAIATSILANDTETVSAAAAATLATLTGFSLHGNFLILDDTAANLETATPAAIALASGVNLTSDARISEATALQFVAMGLAFSPNGFFVTIADTAANLEALAASPSALIVVNGWNGEAVLSADATVSVANANLLSQLSGFNVGTHHLTISDSASNLLGAGGGVLALAFTVQISQASTVTAANAATLEALHNFFANGLLTITDTPANLAAMVASLAAPATAVSLAVETGGNASGYAIDAMQFAAMLALPHFSLTGFADTVAVTDTAASLAALAPSLTGLSLSVLSQITMTLDAAATVTVATAEALHALPDFSRGGFDLTISDTAINIAALDLGTAALATSIVTIGGSSSLSVAAFDSLVGSEGFSGTPDSLTVSDTATNLLTLVDSSNLTYIASTILSASATLSVLNAELLSTLPNLLIGNDLAIADTAANLLHIAGVGSLPDDWTVELQASSVTLTADALSVSAAQAALLAQLGSRFSNGGFTLTVQDTPTALLGLTNGLGAIAGQISSIALASGTWTLTLAQAEQLDSLPHFTIGLATGVIADTVANLSASANAILIAAIIAAVPSITFTLAGNDTASVAQAEALHTTLGSYFTRGSSTLTIIDGAGHLATLDAPTAALASAIELQGSTLTSVANFEAIRALPNYSNNGNLLVVSDTAAHLLGLVSSDVSLASEIMLSTSATNLSAAQAEQLATLSNFTTGIAHFTILDSAADLLQITGEGSQPDDWAGELAARTVTLTGNATVTAAQAAELALLGSRFSVGENTLTVSDSAANLVSAANAGGLALAGVVTLSGDETALSAANATQLAALSHFNKGGHQITVSDTAANLAFAGNAAGLALADHEQLSQASTMTVAAAEALIGTADFQVNGAAPITINDTLPNLLELASADLANNNILAATPIELSTSAVATVAQMHALAALAQYSTFSLNGNTITVEDSGRHLATFTADTIAVPSAYVMIGDATLSAAQAGVLAAEGAQIGDNNLTVADTPTALLGLSDAVNMLATGLELSGASSATAAQATQLETLAGEQRFSTGGYALTVTGSASALLALSTPTQQMATTLVLSESGDTVSVANLVQLTELGSKFALSGQTMTVSDTATQLATLNSLETALVNAAVLDQSTTIGTTTATELAALPGFALGDGVTLTVQGTYAELAALPGSITSIATLELTGSAQTLTAAQAAALVALSNFSPSSGVIVQDTIADLNAGANAGWPAAATGGYIVTDSISNLLDNASTTLLANAYSVTLLGDAQVDAAQFATLAGMANFSRGTAALTVIDGSVAIANNAVEIGLLASSALIDSSAPVSAAQAEALATLNTAHMLSFTSGVSVVVQDSFANLALSGNAAGLALASTITVLDTGAQLATATAYGWGSVQPYFELNASGDITGAQATALHGVGGHFLPESFTLTVTDNAANVVSNATAIQALEIGAQVTDSTAGVDSAASALAALGGTLQSISLTDIGPVTAAAAAGLVPVAAKLTGPAIAVSDTASAVDINLAALIALGAHLSTVTVDDSSADVSVVAPSIAALGSKLQITLTDTTPVTVSADVAAGLVPVEAYLGSTVVNVFDTGAHIAADAAPLAELGSVLGTVTLSDGTTTSAATAAALAPIDQHLGTGVTLSVTDTAAAIAGAGSGLATLQTDGKISSIVAANEAVANVLTYGAALASLHATATISDTSAAVSAQLNALELLSGVGGVATGITLTDGGVPDISLSLQQLTTDADVLGLISSPFHYAIIDSSANIAADLGSLSKILTLGSSIDSIGLTAGTTLTLPVDVLLRAGVANQAGTALTKLASGDHVAVTGVTVVDFTNIDALSVTPISFTVADSGGGIAIDLELGTGSSELLAHRTSIVGITPTSTITLDYATATTLHVNDGAGSVFSKMTDVVLAVTGVPVAGIGALLTTGVPPSSITVTDTAANIAADLETGSPVLAQYAAEITGITINPTATLTLDAAHVLAANTQAPSLLTDLSSATLAVTGALVSQLDALHGMSLVPSSVAVSDTASAIATDLALGADSRLETYAADGMVTAIVATGGPVSLADSSLSAVPDALALLPAGGLQVTGVPISDIANVAGIGAVLASMAVSDSAANITADLNLDASSELALHRGVIASVTVTGGPISLTDAQALAAESTALALLPPGSLEVTGVTVADIASIAEIGALSGMTVSDTAANIATDLALGASSSELELNVAAITSVTVTSGTVTLTDVAALAVTAALALLPAGTLIVSDVPVADIATIAGLTALASMTVLDTAAAVHTDLVGDTSVLETDVVAGTITSIIVNNAAVALTDAQAEQVLDALAVLIGTGGLTVSGVTIADVPTIAALSALTSMTVSDTASNVQADLLNGATSVLEESAGSITGITFSSGTSVSLTDGQAELVLAALAHLPASSLTVSAVSVADVPAIAALSALATMTVQDTAANIHTDLVLGESSALENNAGVISGITYSAGFLVSLIDAQAELVLSALAELPAGGLTVSAVSVADVATIAALSSLTTMSVSDAVGIVQTDLNSDTSFLVASSGKISSITLTGGTTLTMTVAQIDAASSALPLIVSYSLGVDDTASNVQNDLALGASSVIVAHHTHITSATLISGNTITLTESQATASFVAGFLQFTANLSSFIVTGATVAQIGTVLGLGIPSTTMTLSDSAVNVQNDLALGETSQILGNISGITSIVLPTASTITLSESQAVFSGVATALDLATNLSHFTVQGVAITQIATVVGLDVANTDVQLLDSIAAVQSDLQLGASSVILAHSANIGAITMSSSGAMSLTESQAVYAGVAAMLNLDTNLTGLTVTGVTVAQIAAVAGLAVAHTSIAVSDSALNVQNDLALGLSSAILASLSEISVIALPSTSTITLTGSEAVYPGVTTALGLATNLSVFDVTGTLVDQIGTIVALAVAGTSIAIADSQTNVQNDLALGSSSAIMTNAGEISGIQMTGGSTISLTEAQALADGVSTALGLIGGLTGFVVTGVTVAQVTDVEALAIADTTITISDTALDIQNDLALGAASVILNNPGVITGITPPDASTITLTEAEAVYSGVATALGLITNSDIIVEITNVAVNQIGTATALNIHNTELAISDTASAVQTDLALGASSQIVTNIATIKSIALPSSSTITLTEGQAVHSGVATALIEATNLATFAVTGVTLAQVATVAALDVPHTKMAISGTFSSVMSDLTGGSSVLVPNVASISTISVSGGPFITTMTAAQILAPGVGAVLDLLTSTIAMHVNTDVSHIGAVLALGVNETLFQVSDTSFNMQQDLASGSSGLVAIITAGSVADLNSVTLTDSSPSITLTEAQATASHVGTVLNDINMSNSYTFTVTGVTIAQMTTVLALGISNTHMAIVDTAANVETDLTLVSPTLVSNVASITGITLTGGDTLTLTVAQIANDQAVLALIGTYQLAVSDTAAHIESDLAAGTPTMAADVNNISTITMTDVGPQTLHLSIASLVADTGLLAKIVSSFNIDISDTAADVQGDLTSGSSQILANLVSITGIVLTDGSTPTITLTVAQLGADTAALALISSPFHIAITDTAAHVQADLAAGVSSSILSQIGNITGITLTSGNAIALTEAQMVHAGVDDSGTSAVALIGDLNSLIATAATIAQISTLLALTVPPTEIRITDSIAHIGSDISGAGVIAATNTGSPGLITTVTPSDASTDVATATTIHNGLPSGVTFEEGALTISDTAGNLLTAHGSLPVILTNALLVTLSANATGVTAANATLLSTILGGSLNSHTLEIADTSTNLLNSGNAAGIALATTVELLAPETMSAATATLVAALLGFAAGPAITISDSIANLTNSSYLTGLGIATTLTPTDASANVADATTVHTLAVAAGATFNESGLTITDTASALLGALTAILTAAEAVALSANATGVTAAHATTLADLSNFSLNGKTLAVVDTSSQLLSVGNAAGIALATTVELLAPETMSAATATALDALHGFTAGPAITISDTIADLANAANATGLGIATTVTPTDTVATVAQLTAILAALAIGATFPEAALTISDTALHLLAAPPNLLSGVSLVTLSTNAAGLTAAQATTLTGILNGAANGHTINVVDTAANLLSSANAAGIAFATSVGVSDTAANMLALAPVLIAMEPLLTSATITDSGPLSASAVSDLLALPNLSAGSLTIADTGSQIAAAIEANGATGVTFLEAHSVQLSANSIIGASDAAALEQLGGSLNKNSFTLSVSDTASHLTDTADGYLAAVSDTSLVNGVYLKATGGTVTVTAAVGAALIGIPNFHKNPVGGGTNILIVQDTAAHFDSNYTTLLTDLALFDHLYLSSSATVTDAVYGELLGLGVHRASVGVTLTVRDTASNIAANATTQLGSSPTITPIAWQLSGSATVTESQAAVLGGLGGFSSGAYILTLSASASGVSVSDANALGVLGSAFHLGGFTVNVTGSVATLSALTSGALAVVTPQISDLFSNIAQMSPTSNLLGGTMTVTDSEAITVAQATSFFALVKVGSGSGITAANITFNAGVETITDTLANMQTLTGLSSWTANVPLHSDFHLEVADTVTNLILPANTTALSGMYATTLAGNQTVTAANLETLFNLESTIHFTLGSNQLTIQDTAADLLNTSYSDAIAMAQHLTLLGPDTVVTADAETLMGTGKLVLTSNTILTISDTSTDLLDGVLGGAITSGGFTSFVHVTLSDDETLDAQTAEALVSLPGYAAGAHTLSIVDGASYLLNAANHSAEVDATSVTLDGDANVSAATAVSLVGLPNFALDGNTLYLASNDYADAVTLTTLAGLGSGFNLNGNTLTLTQDASVTATQLAGVGDFGTSLHLGGHTLTMTQDALALTPNEYAAVVADGVALNGHALSAMPTGVTVSEVSGNVEFDGTGVTDATVTLYGAGGAVVTTASASPSFTIAAAESGSGVNVAVTETVSGTESAPIIALEHTILTNAATTDSATFATSGQVQVGTNEYMNLYTAGSQPLNPANPVLVYDPAAHTLSFDAAGHSAIVLLTLGSATHPASLDPSEIFVKHFNPG